MKTKLQIIKKIAKLEKYVKIHEDTGSDADMAFARCARQQILLLDWVLK